jgi:hypothetical protein
MVTLRPGKRNIMLQDSNLVLATSLILANPIVPLPSQNVKLAMADVCLGLQPLVFSAWSMSGFCF